MVKPRVAESQSSCFTTLDGTQITELAGMHACFASFHTKHEAGEGRKQEAGSRKRMLKTEKDETMYVRTF